MLKQLFIAVGISSAVIGVIGFSGCAKQEFRKEQFTASASAVGFRYLPAKVDILMVPDNTGSTNNIFPQLQGTMSGFISSLQGKYWDYHVGRSPVYYSGGTRHVSNPILVNGQFNTNVLADGSTVATTGLVPSDRATTNLNAFPILEDTGNATGSGDDTYYNTILALQNAKADTYTNFLRPDAILAVVVVTNGYDRNITDQNGALTGAGSANLQNYANQLIAIKGSSKLIRFYSVAAYGYLDGGANSYCLSPGGTSRPGKGFFDMIQFIPGLQKFDGNGTDLINVCNPYALSNVMGNIEANLEVIRESYVYSNIVLTDEPRPESIQLSSKDKGAIPQNDTNGWSYKGLNTVYTVTGIFDEKTQIITPLTPGLNRRTGYVIQLNGTAQLIGSDEPSLIYEKR